METGIGVGCVFVHGEWKEVRNREGNRLAMDFQPGDLSGEHMNSAHATALRFLIRSYSPADETRTELWSWSSFSGLNGKYGVVGHGPAATKLKTPPRGPGFNDHAGGLPCRPGLGGCHRGKRTRPPSQPMGPAELDDPAERKMLAPQCRTGSYKRAERPRSRIGGVRAGGGDSEEDFAALAEQPQFAD